MVWKTGARMLVPGGRSYGISIVSSASAKGSALVSTRRLISDSQISDSFFFSGGGFLSIFLTFGGPSGRQPALLSSPRLTSISRMDCRWRALLLVFSSPGAGGECKLGQATWIQTQAAPLTGCMISDKWLRFAGLPFCRM